MLISYRLPCNMQNFFSRAFFFLLWKGTFCGLRSNIKKPNVLGSARSKPPFCNFYSTHVRLLSIKLIRYFVCRAPAGTKRRGGPGGLNKLCGVSPKLQAIVGQPALPRTEVCVLRASSLTGFRITYYFMCLCLVYTEDIRNFFFVNSDSEAAVGVY